MNDLSIFCAVVVMAGAMSATAAGLADSEAVPNRPPLQPTPFIPLDLGAVKARGWLEAQLKLQADGLTGHAEEVIPDLDENSAWLGGTGEAWEKGAYYVKGLVPLAYVLNDEKLKKQAQKWIDWTLENQRENGQIGPLSNDDWWPRMVITWALRDYYEATNDPRVIDVLMKYARYMQEDLPKRPLAEWGKARGADQADTLFWLYNRTGEKFLLEVADLLLAQTNKWEQFFKTLRGVDGDFFSPHGVNVSQAMKYPIVAFERSGNPGDREAFESAWSLLHKRHGLGIGMWSGTEPLAGRSSTQGVEMCTIVEQMLSSEMAMKTLGEPEIGDQLERIAFNLLPGGTTKDFKQYQYYTLPNQPVARRGNAGFRDDHRDDLLPGPHSGFHCCCYNLHMGWPKYVQHAWMATEDGGLAAVAYGPTEVSVKLGSNPVTITEETNYPFSDAIKFVIKPRQAAAFPLKLRIPGWSVAPQVAVNGQAVQGVKPGEFLTINRTWKSGDVVTASFPSQLTTANSINGSATIWRGPLLFSLRVKENKTPTNEAPDGFNEFTIEPASPWNYALDIDRANPMANIKISQGPMPANPWLPDTAPIKLTVPAKKLPGWGLAENELLAAEVPPSPVTSAEPVENVTLVPFGSQTLRITSFPLLRGAAVPDPGVTASHHNASDALEAILDNPTPTSSKGENLPRFTWWDHVGTEEWIQWTFEKAETVSAVSVYWFDDSGSGRCRVPKSWNVLYRDGDQWLPVKNASGFGTGVDMLNAVSFEPVTTDAIRIEVQLQDGFSGGILQWIKK